MCGHTYSSISLHFDGFFFVLRGLEGILNFADLSSEYTEELQLNVETESEDYLSLDSL